MVLKVLRLFYCKGSAGSRKPPLRDRLFTIAVRAAAAICLLVPGPSAFALAVSPEDDLLAAQDAFRANQSTRLDAAAQRLKGTIFEPYGIYWQLEIDLDKASQQDVASFLKNYSDSPLSSRLLSDWLKNLGKQQNWTLFSQYYPPKAYNDTELKCYALQSRLATAGNDAATAVVLQEAKQYWFNGSDMPESCSPLFQKLIDTKLVSEDEIWQRIRLALEAGNVSVARSVIQYLPDPEMNAMKSLRVVVSNPARYLDRTRHDYKTRPGRELAMFAVYRIARTDIQRAYEIWSSLSAHFDKEDQSYVWGILAFQGARKHDPAALSWFQLAAADKPLSPLQLEWKVRLALRLQDWDQVLQGIENMPSSQRNQGVWRYWKARALKATGHLPEANTLWAPLSRERNFYGQLAAEELGASIGNPPAEFKPTNEEINSIENIRGIQRALALYRAGLRRDANREWMWNIRGMNDKQLLAAAELARRNAWYDRSISTAEQTQQLHDFGLRFPSPHRETLGSYAQDLGLDEAWVYGLIRQESRFVQEAKSSVGASGLMQLMPSTARWVAKKMGLRDYKRSLINQLDTNIAMGTFYLKHVLDQLGDQEVLATAAYNAGMSRAKRWQDERKLEGAIYVESIPFSETRDYVKKVMSNASYYASRFGQKLISLKQRLGDIAGRSDNQDTDSDNDEP